MPSRLFDKAHRDATTRFALRPRVHGESNPLTKHESDGAFNSYLFVAFPSDRVQDIAPYLEHETSPNLVVVEGNLARIVSMADGNVTTRLLWRQMPHNALVAEFLDKLCLIDGVQVYESWIPSLNSTETVETGVAPLQSA